MTLGSAPKRDKKTVLAEASLPLSAMKLLKSRTMSHATTTLDFSHAPYKNKLSLSESDREIEIGELRLRYIQLIRDDHKTLGKEDAINLIKESERIWKKLIS